MGISFNDYSALLLQERKFDAILGAAADKSYALVMDDMIEGCEYIAKFMMDYISRPPVERSEFTAGGLGGTGQGSTRNYLYIYAGQSHRLESGSQSATIKYNPDAFKAEAFILFREALFNSNLIQSQTSAVIGVTDPVYIPQNYKKYAVIPSNVFSNKDVSDMFDGGTPRVEVRFHISMNVRVLSANDPAAGTYKTPWIGRGDKPRYMNISSPIINVGGLTAFNADNITQLVMGLIQNGNKPIVMRKIARTWVDKVRANLIAAKVIYLHEYIHFFDDIRMRSVVPQNVKAGTETAWKSGVTPKEFGTYYKSDIEWNAHFQEYATLIRSAFSDFMTAIQSNVVALASIPETERDVTSDKLHPTAIQVKNPKQQIHYNRIVTTMNRLIFKRLHDQQTYRVSVLGSFIADIEMNSNRTPEQNENLSELRKLITLFKQRPHTLFNSNPTAAFFYFILDIFMMKRQFVSYMMEDQKFRKKFLARIYSVAEDMKKIYDDAIAKVKAGKFPSKQAWNKALSRFRDIKPQKFKGISKEWSETLPMGRVAQQFYVGIFMDSITRINGPIDLTKPMSSELQGYADTI